MLWSQQSFSLWYGLSIDRFGFAITPPMEEIGGDTDQQSDTDDVHIPCERQACLRMGQQLFPQSEIVLLRLVTRGEESLHRLNDAPLPHSLLIQREMSHQYRLHQS